MENIELKIFKNMGPPKKTQDFLHYPLSKAGQSMKTPNGRMNYGFEADRVSQKLVVNAFKENAKANRGTGTDPKTLTLC